MYVFCLFCLLVPFMNEYHSTLTHSIHSISPHIGVERRSEESKIFFISAPIQIFKEETDTIPDDFYHLLLRTTLT